MKRFAQILWDTMLNAKLKWLEATTFAILVNLARWTCCKQLSVHTPCLCGQLHLSVVNSARYHVTPDKQNHNQLHMYSAYVVAVVVMFTMIIMFIIIMFIIIIFFQYFGWHKGYWGCKNYQQKYAAIFRGTHLGTSHSLDQIWKRNSE